MSDNIFETASRNKYRFRSIVGDLTVEDLWDLPLTTTRPNKVSLDSVAKTVNLELKDVTTESFVTMESNPAKTVLETKLELVKYVIAAKLKENQVARDLAAKKAEREKIKEILGRKQDAALENLSEEELLARLS